MAHSLVVVRFLGKVPLALAPQTVWPRLKGWPLVEALAVVVVSLEEASAVVASVQ